MPPTPTPRHREPGRAGAAGRIVAAMAATLAGGGAIGPMTAVATAQAPGLETFARQPETPLQLWDAISYLTRVGRTDQALPLLDRFLQANPDDATWLEIRDRYGVGSILTLQDDPRTAFRVPALIARLNEAVARYGRREDRIRRAIALLSGSPGEQSEALLRLRESGPYAVPYLLEAIAAEPPGSPTRALLVGNLGRLDRRTVPALIAGLDAPDLGLAADVASALGRIGDRRALPFLVSEWSGNDDARAPVRVQAADAIRRLAGEPAEAVANPPARYLLDEARRYLTGAFSFPGPRVEVWSWQGETVAPAVVGPGEAEGRLGQRFAARALELAPDSREAAAVLAALRLRERLAGLGPEATPAPGTLPEEVEAELQGLGPEALLDTLTWVLDARQYDVAPALLGAIGRSAEPTILLADPPSPLVAALSVPDRRVQLAAALAISTLDPTFGFPGSSRVVPILSRSLLQRDVPEVVVVSGRTPMLTTLADRLKRLGFEPLTAATADEGFALAASSAGVEALIVDPSFLRGARDAEDLLIDLRADARTAGLPVLLPLPIDPARAIARGEEYNLRQSEVEPNDIPVRASPVAFVGVPRRARIDGRLSPDDRPPFSQPKRTLPGPADPDAADADADLSPPPLPTPGNLTGDEPKAPLPDISGDLFALGPLGPGDALSAIIEPSPGSTLRPTDVALWLERRDGPGFEPVATALGSLAVTIDTPGVFDLRVQAAERPRHGYRALYTLDVTLYDSDAAVLPIPGTARLIVEALARRFDRVGVLAAPGDPSAVLAGLDAQWRAIGAVPIPAAERRAMAAASASAVGAIAGKPDGPFAADLARAVPVLRRALAEPDRAADAASALAAVPTAEAQRDLADVALDGSRPLPTRVAAATALRDSIGRFGPLLAADQRPRLLRIRGAASDPALRAALDAVAEALARPVAALPPMGPGLSGAGPDGAPFIVHD